ncbi:MAG TPA: metallopeptidase family protein [Actinopolymorphaceae bacterium]
MRGPLAVSGPLSPDGLPVARSRSQTFDDLVLEAVERIEQKYPEELAEIEFVVEAVPDPTRSDALDGLDGAVPLGAIQTARGEQPARVIVYRRPIELRTVGPTELSDLVSDVVVEQVAELLGMHPEDIDPAYGEDDED